MINFICHQNTLIIGLLQKQAILEQQLRANLQNQQKNFQQNSKIKHEIHEQRYNNSSEEEDF
jgi:hypothetical protein